MEHRKLTKEDIDKIRDIEGFPIGSDENIIALSDAPYYTACPNPFIEDFIKEKGTPYDEATDDYHREPFTSDVSEGKNDPLYVAHSYHTKVPYRAIMKYIIHYTEPGDVVFDGFCGTGMTGVAAQMCDNQMVENPGARYAVINDLSPIAAFIAHNYNGCFNDLRMDNMMKSILDEFISEYSWMYETKPLQTPFSCFQNDNVGVINYTVWSDVYICPHCGSEFVFWDVAVDHEKGIMRDSFACPHCQALLRKRECLHAWEYCYDTVQRKTVKIAKQEPVLINYFYGGRRYNKKPDENDFEVIERVNNYEITSWLPTDIWPTGEKTGEPKQLGYQMVYQIYTKRNQIALSFIYQEIIKAKNTDLLSYLTAVANRNLTRCNRFMINKYNPQGRVNGPMPGNLYISPLVVEQNAFELLAYKAKDITTMHASGFSGNNVMVTNQSSTDLSQIGNNTIDYIFTDPPFGYNINYSELNFINEAWLKIKTNSQSEAIMSLSQGKGLVEYQKLMQRCFEEFYRILKPNRWITVEFHNSKNAIWNAIQEAISVAGFVVADVRTLDKRQRSINQDNAKGAVQQDLVISAYKPKDSFKKTFFENTGSEATAWAFIRQHLANIPVVVRKNDRIELIAERQAYLLFDRMVAYHIMQGIPVPLDASDFYRGLDEKFLKRDGMYFLSNQVNEYDTARIKMDVEDLQLSLFVSNEKDAVAWLYRQLSDESGGPKTYAELQPMFMQEVKSIDRYEKMPELSVLLDENFVQDDRGSWYVPDRTKEGDIAKLREKNLWKEFEGYMNSKEKLKLFRSEAIRVGFSRLWKEKNYQAIVDIAERLPEQTIQEDANLLMYYDISLSRV